MPIPPFETLLKQIKFFLPFIGIRFNETPNKVLFFFVTILVTLMIIEETAYIVNRVSSENFIELMHLAPCVVLGVMALIKIIYIYYKREKVFRLTRLLRELYGQIRMDEVKVACVKSQVLGTKSLTKYYFLLNIVLTSTYNFAALPLMLYEYVTQGTVTFIFPYAVVVPFDVHYWFGWLIVYVQSTMCGYFCIIFFTTVDTLYCNLTCQLCINFSVLSNEIQNLAANDDKKLRDIVKRHQYLLELTQELEDIFTGPNFFNVLSQALIICMLLFDFKAGSRANMPGCALWIGSAVLQILMTSVFGEHLQHESGKIGDAAFTCPWYEMSESNKKTIMIIKQSALKPQVLTALNFCVIGYACFSKIMRTSWSFFTLLNTVYDTNSG